MGIIKLTLPEWVFLDSNTHLGDELKERAVLLHVRTHTILEFFSLDELELILNPEIKQRKFTYKNSKGGVEYYIVAVHYSLTEFADLEEVIDKAIRFFKDWMTWMDKNINKEYTTIKWN